MDNNYHLVAWPYSQMFMEHERFHECLLVQDIEGHDEVGGNAYMVPDDLYQEFYGDKHLYILDYENCKLIHVVLPNYQDEESWLADNNFNYNSIEWMVSKEPLAIEEMEY